MIVEHTQEEGRYPGDTEARLAKFTELTATRDRQRTGPRVELRGFAEQSPRCARVATLVAQGCASQTPGARRDHQRKAGRLLHADYATMNRFGPDGSASVVASWSSTGAAYRAGTRWGLGGRNVNTLVFQTGRAARIDDYASATGPAAELSRELGLRSGVGVPVSVEGRPWGCMFVSSTREPLPAGTEARLAGFTALAATAIANTEAQDALTASRAQLAASRGAGRRSG